MPSHYKIEPVPALTGGSPEVDFLEFRFYGGHGLMREDTGRNPGRCVAGLQEARHFGRRACIKSDSLENVCCCLPTPPKYDVIQV